MVPLIGVVVDAMVTADAQRRPADGITELPAARLDPIDVEGGVVAARAALDQGVLVPEAIVGHCTGDGPVVADAQIAVAGFLNGHRLPSRATSLRNDRVGAAVASRGDRTIGLSPDRQAPIASHRDSRTKGVDVVINPIEV